MEITEMEKMVLEANAAIKAIEARIKALLELLGEEGVIVPEDVEEREREILEREGDKEETELS